MLGRKGLVSRTDMVALQVSENDRTVVKIRRFWDRRLPKQEWIEMASQKRVPFT